VQGLPLELWSLLEHDERTRLIADQPVSSAMRGGRAAVDRLPVDTPSLRLLADKAAQGLAGTANAFNGLALLVAAALGQCRTVSASPGPPGSAAQNRAAAPPRVPAGIPSKLACRRPDIRAAKARRGLLLSDSSAQRDNWPRFAGHQETLAAQLIQ
jgi:hypothetical protein